MTFIVAANVLFPCQNWVCIYVFRHECWSVGVECWWGLQDAVMSASTRSILVTAVFGTEEHLTSVTSIENYQLEYNVLGAHTASFKKLLLQLTRGGCRHSTLRRGLWAVYEALDHTTNALQCRHVPCFVRRLVYLLDHT